MRSPTHRDNILNENYRDIGIAVVDGVLDGRKTTLVVQMFGTRASQPQDLAAVEEEPSILKQEVLALDKEEEVKQQMAEAEEVDTDEEVAQKESTEEVSTSDQKETKIDPDTYLEKADKNNAQEGTLISKFKITKEFSIALIFIVMIALIIDMVFISKKNIVRISGKSIVHFIFLVIILLIIWFSTRGQIL
jgi:hypothetical protein